MDNKDCNCCNNSRDFLNMNNCKNYAWEYKALKSLLYKISYASIILSTVFDNALLFVNVHSS